MVKDIRILLSEKDLKQLVKGEIVYSRHFPGRGFNLRPLSLSVAIALQDIGFDMVHQLVDEAERELEEKHG